MTNSIKIGDRFFQRSCNIDVGLREQEYSTNLPSAAIDGKSVSQAPSYEKDTFIFNFEEAFCPQGIRETHISLY